MTETTFALTKDIWDARHGDSLAQLVASGKLVAVHLSECEDLQQSHVDKLCDQLSDRIVVLDLKGCKTVRSVTRLDCSVTPLDWRRLVELNLSDTGVTQDGIVGIVAPCLEVLQLQNCRHINDIRMLLRGCNSLTTLSLSGTGVTQAGIDGIQLRCLEWVSLRNCRGVSDVCMLLRGCNSLTTLTLAGTSVTQAGIAGIEAPLLEWLSLKGCNGITDVSLLLRGCKSLKHLDLSGTSVTQAGIAGIEAPLLEWLSFKDCNGITDVSLLLRGCSSLGSLILARTNVTLLATNGVQRLPNISKRVDVLTKNRRTLQLALFGHVVVGSLRAVLRENGWKVGRLMFQGQLLHDGLNVDHAGDIRHGSTFLELGPRAWFTFRRDHMGRMPAATAAEGGHRDALEVLFRCNDVEIRQLIRSVGTSIAVVVQRGHQDVLEFLQQQCHEEFKVDSQFANLLPIAVINGRLEAAKLLLQCRPKSIDEIISFGGVTPLFSAVERGYLDIVELLLRYDAQGVGLRNHFLFHRAAQQGRCDILAALIHAFPDHALALNATNETVFHVAATTGRCDVLALLQLHYPDVAAVTNTEGNTPFHAAVRVGHRDAVGFLLKLCPAGVSVKNNHGDTMFHLAAESGHLDMLEMLLRQYPEGGGLQNNNGETAYHVAASRGHSACIALLLRYCPDTATVPNNHRETPLHVAWKAGHLQIATLISTLR